MKTKKRVKAFLLGLTVISMLFTGCSNPTSDTPNTPDTEPLTYTDGDFYLVGLVNCAGDDDYNLTDETIKAGYLMAKVENGIYQKVINITDTGDLDFQITNDDWSEKFTSSGTITVGTSGGTLEVAAMVNGKVTIDAAGTYVFRFDLGNNTITVQTVATVQPLDLDMYLVGAFVGDGTANWSQDASTITTNLGSGIYTKDVTISSAGTSAAEALDFQLADSSWTYKYTSDSTVTVETEADLVKAGMTNGDITTTETGIYTITFDVVNMTIKVVKQ